MWTPSEGDFERCKLAYDAFQVYAAFDGELVEHAHTFSELQCRQIEHCRWESRCFGYQGWMTPALGIAEECGEMIEALELADEAEFKDSVGDMMVYATSYCTKLRLDMETLIDDLRPLRHPDPMSLHLSFGKVIGRIAHCTLKAEQRIRGFDDKDYARTHLAYALRVLFQNIFTICHRKEVDAKQTYVEVIDKVLKREWDKDRVAAGGRS